MKLKRALGTLACVVGISAFASIANADPIGPDCGSCHGGVYTLEFTEIDETHIVLTLTADMTGEDVDVTGIGAVAFKIVANDSEITAVSLVTSPTDWGNHATEAGLAANGCTDSSPGFVCSQSVTPISLATAPTDPFVWVFNVTLSATANLLLDPGAASIKIDFNPTGGGPLLSEGITLQGDVPDVPDGGSTLALLGSALLGIGILRRRFNL